MTILVGTASWTDKTLIACKRFYPRGCSTAEARLRHYATQFPMVEVDSSYYAMPAPAVAQGWVDRTPPAFVFNIKAFRLFTGHQTSPVVLHDDIRRALPPSDRKMLYYRDFPGELRDELWRRFIEALAPLKDSGKLAAVHFQFAPWVLCNAAGHARVRECVERMAGHHLSVEFRNISWFNDKHRYGTLAFERELGVTHTIVDGPQGFTNSVPSVWEATNPGLAILRLHGRNHETWDIKGSTAASDRFNYDYADAELAALVPIIKRISALVARLQVIFNNNMEDQGQRNARSLMNLLEI